MPATMKRSQPAIVVQDLVKIYRVRSGDSVRALDGLSLGVQQGEIFGLLGRNGAGKTTLLRILTTLVQPTAGSASVMGLDVTKYPYEVRKQICTVLQENAVELYLSVEDNLATYGRFQSIPRSEIKHRVARVLEQFGLAEYRNQKVIDLSGGLKRRVQVSKVFMVDRPVVFLDEATTGMDPINKRGTIEAIRTQARLGRTIFLTTHILQEAEELCDTIAIVDRGRIVAQGNLEMIKSLSSRAFDMSITFEKIDEAILHDLRELPLLKLTHKHNTAEICVKGNELSALSILKSLSDRHTILHFEVGRATLEDVFLEILGHGSSTAGEASP
jgi:ABC-2 type transport system ATP-binding protein